MNVPYMLAVYLVWFLATYYIVFFSLVLLMNRGHLFERRRLRSRPKVTVIVPAFNEEGKIGRTIKSLQRLKYTALEIIIVNDGSRDGTSKEVRAAIKGDRRFHFIDRKENKGKAASLNEAIKQATGIYVACMDADSIVDNTIFQKVLPYFDEEDVGAVTVTVEILKPKKFLDKIIDMEFTIGLSLFLKVFSFFNCVFVTPGPFSVFRKDVLDEIGGFDEQNITEDLEIAYRLHKAHYRIVNCMEGKVYTIVPPTFKDVYIQRRRWYSGAIETMIQHKDILFKRKFGIFGFFIPFNYLLIILGLTVFAVTTYLSLSRGIETLWNFHYTGWNFFAGLRDWEFDILRWGRVSILGITGFLFSLIMLVFGITFTKKDCRNRKLGLLGYPFLFFLYQIFWIGAFFAVIRRKKVSWR